MKKIIGIILIVVGIISTSIGVVTLFNVKSNVASSVAIIGGADGPTSIFLAGKIGAPMYGAIIVGIAVFVIGLLLVLLKKKQDQ